MKPIALLFIISLFLTSCATMMNETYVKTTINTTKPSSIIFKADTIKTVKNKASLTLERSQEPIKISLFTDSTNLMILLKPKNSFYYYSNILFNYGIGMLVDRKSPKRYTYPQRIYINSSDSIGKYSSYAQSDNKGEVDIHLSLPHINSFNLSPDNETAKLNTGFLGISVGLDYYHSKNQYVSLRASGVTDFFIPFPAPVRFEGERESMSSSYLSLSNNHKIKRLSLGYGISYSKNTWNLQNYGQSDSVPSKRERVKKSNKSLGFAFSTYLQTTEHF